MQLNEMPLDDAIHLKQMLRKDDSWRPPQVLLDAYDCEYDQYITMGSGPMGPIWLAVVRLRAEVMSGVCMKTGESLTLSPLTTKPSPNGQGKTKIGPPTNSKFTAGCLVTAQYDGKEWEGEYVKSWGGEKALVRLKGMDGVKWNQIPLKDIRHREVGAAA
jgi:hypothetical protein